MAAEPERGDIVVFKHPSQNVDFIKRVVGLPGDRLQLTDGILSINGDIVPQVERGLFTETMEQQGSFGNLPACSNRPVGMGGTCEKELAIETLPNGSEHFVLNIFDNGPFDNTPVYTVPPGHYFMMGDNRDNSGDSRNISSTGVGYVPFENLIGRADRVIVSSAGRRILYFWTWRSDRFFKALN